MRERQVRDVAIGYYVGRRVARRRQSPRSTAGSDAPLGAVGWIVAGILLTIFPGSLILLLAPAASFFTGFAVAYFAVLIGAVSLGVAGAIARRRRS
jgi:hypothetical protein